MRDHEERVSRLEAELDEHRRYVPENRAKALTVQNYKEKDAYLHYEVIHFSFNKCPACHVRQPSSFVDISSSSLLSLMSSVVSEYQY